MADPLDEDLAKGLRQARKKPRNFAIIAKGPKILKMMVQKKPLKVGELQKAKVEYKGNLIIRGTCMGDGGPGMVFNVTEEPSIKTAVFRAFITEQTELKMKPRFEVVAELEEVDDDSPDDAADALESESGESEADETPPAPPPAPQSQSTADESEQEAEASESEEVPPAPPPPPDAAGKQLLAALNKLTPAIKTAVTADPARKNDFLQPVASIQKLVGEGKLDEAKGQLLQLGQLLKQASAGQTPPTAPPPPPPTQPEATAPPPPPPPAPDRGEVLEAKWQQTLAKLEPQYLDALKTAPGELANKLRVMYTYATEQAEAQQYDKALAAVARLEPLLQEAAASGGAEEIPQDIVTKRKFLVTRFQEIPREIRPKLNELKQAINANVPDENADELCGAIEEALQSFYDEIQDEIDEAINTGDMGRIRGLKQRVEKNELITLLSSNPMTSGKPFQESLIGALNEIEQNLAG